jgi:hypothetical protein
MSAISSMNVPMEEGALRFSAPIGSTSVVRKNSIRCHSPKLFKAHKARVRWKAKPSQLFTNRAASSSFPKGPGQRFERGVCAVPGRIEVTAIKGDQRTGGFQDRVRLIR